MATILETQNELFSACSNAAALDAGVDMSQIRYDTLASIARIHREAKES